MKTFFRFCVTEGLRNDNPAEGLTIKVPKKVFEVPTPEEIEAMLAHCRSRPQRQAARRDHRPAGDDGSAGR